jgi:hypothetical protein
MATETLNIQKTAQAIIDWANKAPLGRSINMNKLREKLDAPDAEEFLKEACVFCEVEPVYT